MSTLSLTRPRERSSSRPAIRGLALGPALLALLLALVLLAAFDHGATGLAAGARVQVVIAALGAAAAAGWLGSRTLNFAAPAMTRVALILLAAFAAWSAVSLLWSVSPDGTWTEFNRDLTYVVVAAVAVLLGASYRRAPEFLAQGFLLVAGLVTAYALGQKLLPGVRLDGVLDLDRTSQFPRLQEPLGYWNALALFIAIAIPAALALAVDAVRPARTRILGLVGLQCMLVTLGFTFSRGGVIAVVVAILVFLLIGPSMLRGLMWLALAALGAAPALIYGLSARALTTANVSLARRESAGLVLLALLLGAIALVVGLARVLQRREAVTRISPERVRRLGRLLGLTTGVVVLAAVLAVAFSHRGIGGTASDAWHSFTTTRATSNYNPDRLLSADSENRWVWWKEAAGAFSARPLQGWGAGSFPVVHLLYRRDTLTVNQPHSAPMQFLAETGIVGTVLSLGAVALLLVAAARAARDRIGRERLAAAALLGGGAAYAVHFLYDWDWDIPAVTIPALLFLGVLAGLRVTKRSTGTPQAGSAPSATATRAGGSPAPPRRLLLLALITAGACAVAMSGVLPSLASTKAAGAIVEASGPASVQAHAAAQAALAAHLDPLSDAGLRVEATIAARRGDAVASRDYLLAAVRRDPSDVSAWRLLAVVESSLGDRSAVLTADARALALDPRNPGAAGYARALSLAEALLQTPAPSSPTAQPATTTPGF